MVHRDARTEYVGCISRWGIGLFCLRTGVEDMNAGARSYTTRDWDDGHRAGYEAGYDAALADGAECGDSSSCRLDSWALCLIGAGVVSGGAIAYIVLAFAIVDRCAMLLWSFGS